MSSKLIPDETLTNVRSHFDIVDVIGQYVTLKKSGRNYVGLCPFHSEKTPSFSVSTDKQIYHCFGCGAGGDVIRFMMDIETLTFKEAVSHLADEAGIKLPEQHESTPSGPYDRQKAELIQAHELASKLYHYLLLETEHGKEPLRYLLERGFTRDVIETFKIGFAPSSWDTVKNFLTKRGLKIEVLQKAGLVNESEEGRFYDRFRNRIMFPIADLQGRIIGFGGRVIDDSLPKYLNSPETHIFNKSRTVYNLHLAKKEIRKKRQAILFEGYIDVISSWTANIENGVATLGTSLTEEQAKLIARYGDEVVICYDSDTAGQTATFRAIDVLQQVQVEMKVALLPQGLDPDDFVQKNGKEAFQHFIQKNTMTATAFKLQFMRKEYQFNNDQDKMKYLQKALEVVAGLQHAIEREHYIKELSNEFKISVQSLKNDILQIYKDNRKKKEKTRDNLRYKWNNNINNGNHVGRNNTLHPAFYNAERFLVYYMMKDREVAEKVQSEIGSDFHVEDFSVLAAYLYAYYDEHDEADIRGFISTLDDSYYIQIASKLAMLDISDHISEHELNDYISQVKKHHLDLLMKQKKEEQLQAERENDFAKAAEIGHEIIQLRHEVKKSTF